MLEIPRSIGITTTPVFRRITHLVLIIADNDQIALLLLPAPAHRAVVIRLFLTLARLLLEIMVRERGLNVRICPQAAG